MKMSYLTTSQIEPDPDNDLAMESLNGLISDNLTSDELSEEMSNKLEDEEIVLQKPHFHEIFRRFNEYSIEVIAEQSNIQAQLTQPAAQIVAEDTSYRIRELIHCAAQFMRHSFRTKLTTKDVSKALHELDCDIIFGHNNSQQSLKYQFIPKASVWVIEESQIHLKVLASKIISQAFRINQDDCLNQTSIFNVDWLQLKQFCDNSDSTFDYDESAKLEKYFTQLCDLLCNINCSQFMHLSSFEKSATLSLIYSDLSSNKNIKSLLSRFIKYTINSLRTLQRFTSPIDMDKLTFCRTKLEPYRVFFKVISALFRNTHFVDWSLQSDSFEPFADVLLSICFDPHLCEDQTQLYCSSLEIRSQFAYLFGQVLFKFCLPFTDLQNRLIRMLYDKIRIYHSELPNLNTNNRSEVDYTILILHRYLGFDICLRYLVPLLIREDSPFESYFSDIQTTHVKNYSYLKTKLSKSDEFLQNVSQIMIQGEICLVGELIIKGLALLLVQVAGDFVWMNQSKRLYMYFSEHFGDALAARLTPLPQLAYVKSNQTQWMISWKAQLFHQVIKCPKVEETVQPMTPKQNKSDSAICETSPSSRNRKKKTTGLLESMLSTDTTKMAKNESLSMFTQSLLDSSYRQSEKKASLKIFLYQEDYEKFRNSSNFSSSVNYLIMFDGKRVIDRSQNDPEMFKPPPNLSEWYKLSINYEPFKKLLCHLPSFLGPPFYKSEKELDIEVISKKLSKMENGNVEEETNVISIDQFDSQSMDLESKQDCVKLKRTILKASSRMRHKTFHYHRTRQHLLTSYSLYTQL